MLSCSLLYSANRGVLVGGRPREEGMVGAGREGGRDGGGREGKEGVK